MQNKNILFISTKYIKSNSVLEENLDEKLIKITLKEVQDLDLFQILGAELYKKYENEKYEKSQDSNFQYSDDIILLNNYVKDFLVYAVLLNIPTALNYKFTNKGTVNITDSHANNVIYNNIESVKKYYRNKYDAYRKRLIEYVNKSCNTGSIVAPFSTGWYIKNEVNYNKIAKQKANKTGFWG